MSQIISKIGSEIGNGPAGRRPKLAVVLFNLGGPDQLSSVRPFLLNLFSDKAILRVPGFVRFFLARLITKRRLPFALENYRLLGGSSPLLKFTQAQADSLQALMAERLPDYDVQCFIAMRYWNPRTCQTMQAVLDFNPDELFLLPLYPQFSTTTTGSSLAEWRDTAIKRGMVRPFSGLCCWYDDAGINRALAGAIAAGYRNALSQLPPGQKLRVLFSAHGLPQSIVDSGDPYQYQVETMVAKMVAIMAGPEGIAEGIADLDFRVCYQSRATPQAWLEPSTDTEVERAGAERVALLLVPIAFVSDHSETLVELDIEYRQLAAKHGVPGYFCNPAPNNEQIFMRALADMVYGSRQKGTGICPANGKICPSRHSDCPHNG